MKNIDYASPKKVHFVGIGGISMSGLAQILLNQGFKITGSDMNPTPITHQLEELGITVHIGHHQTHIDSSVDLIVYTAAINKDNPERIRAKDLNIPAIDRATLLGEIMANYPTSIGVSGTHGKTTTTSMLANVLLAAHTDPTISVGGLLDAIKGNIRIGQSSTFLTEACEYTNSFLKFYPKIGMILNVDEDHMDFFKDLDHIVASFKKYAEQIKEDGYLIINNSIEQKDLICQNVKCSVITCGIEDDAEFTARNIYYKNDIFPSFDIYHHENNLGHISLNVPGIHNVHNSLMAFATGYCLDIPFDQIEKGLYNFKGTKKRFEVKGDLKGITIIDDYAHHPTEIDVTLQVAQKYAPGKVWCAFQPHTYTRTKAFLKEFAKSLSQANHVLLADIYAAREKNTGDIHSKDLLPLLNTAGVDAHYFETFDEIEDYILENCSPGDLLITMGAGNISIVGEELLGY